MLWLASAMLAIVAFGSVVLFVMQMRTAALEDAQLEASNVASILAEQVEHAMEAFDTSLRTTARLVNGSTPEDLRKTVTASDFVASLTSERAQLVHAAVMAIADESGIVIAGSHGGRTDGLDISDRDYFTMLRDDPTRRFVVVGPYINRATNEWAVFMARRLSGTDGKFLGVAFAGIPPSALMQTAHAVVAVPGQSFSLFMRTGEMLMRRPDGEKNAAVGAKIEMPGWHEAVAAGGGLYRSPGWFDDNAKYVAVRPLENFPFVIDVAITESAALAKWRERSQFILIGAGAAILAICGLLWAQFFLRERLARARIRAWLRGRRLSAKADELAGVSKRFGVTLDYMSHGVAIFDTEHRLIVSNHCYAELYNIDPAKMSPGMSVKDIFELRIAAGAYAGTPDEYRALARNVRMTDCLDTLANGRVIHMRNKRTDEGGWVTMHEDVTERTRSTERLAYMALHDNLTQLPNRAAFRKRLGEEAGDYLSPDEKSIVLLIDLDGFKHINDTYGHDIGDKVLIEVGARLYRAVGEQFAARLGGDEFVVMIRQRACDEGCVRDLASLLRAEIGKPIEFDNRRISLTMSIGAVVVAGGERDATGVLRRADLALLEAKKRGRDNCCLFDLEMERRYDERVGLAKELRETIERGDLELYYQPIISADDRMIVCMEALARWRHPTRGMVSPAVFIPLAEETGLIVKLGEWVMRQACADAASWPSHMSVAVNVSSLQIAQPRFADTVAAILSATGLPAGRLQIEITESVLLQNDKQTVSELAALHDLGLTFALDDFGTGYASLAYLKVIPLDKVKIDKCFVDDIASNPQSIAIVSAVVVLARGLGIVTTAEGVETREQYETLCALGVMTMQGYFFGRPKPIADYDLENRQSCAA
jgi:diguanylate cyclase (GGDEF)-like protein